MDQILADLATEPRPAIVIMNSCLWDISQYGPLATAMEEYKANLQYLCVQMRWILPSHSLFIWNTTLPVGRNIIGGFLTDDIKWMENHLVYLVEEANFYAVQIMVHHGIDVVDLHYRFANPVQQLGFRVKDGIHWDPRAHRNMTFLILGHICHARDLLSFKQQGATLKRENKTANVWRNNATQSHVTETEKTKELTPTTANSVRMLKNNAIQCHVTEREKAKELTPITTKSVHMLKNNAIQCHVSEAEKTKELTPVTQNSVHMLTNNAIQSHATETEKVKEFTPTTHDSVHTWRNNAIQCHVTETENAKELTPITSNSVYMLKNSAIQCHTTESEKAKELRPTTATSIHCSRFNRPSQRSWLNLADDISSSIELCISMTFFLSPLFCAIQPKPNQRCL